MVFLFYEGSNLSKKMEHMVLWRQQLDQEDGTYDTLIGKLFFSPIHVGWAKVTDWSKTLCSKYSLGYSSFTIHQNWPANIQHNGQLWSLVD